MRYVVSRRTVNTDMDSEAGSGILFCSGLIAGEGLIGILLAILAVVGVADRIDLSAMIDTGILGGLAVFAVAVLAVGRYAVRRK